MDRKYWQNHREMWYQEFPVFPCPKCGSGKLRIKGGESEYTPKGRSEAEHGIPGEQIAVFILKCDKPNCQEIVSLNCILVTDIEQGSPEEGIDVYGILKPTYFSPNLRMFELPKVIPDTIREQVDRAFSNFFTDTAATVNKIRITVELILDQIRASKFKMVSSRNRCGINNPSCSRYSATNTRKRQNLNTLHSRIKHYGTKNLQSKRIADLLLALKIIGNEGSHLEGEISVSDVLDAFEILEYLLNFFFVKNEDRIFHIAAKIRDERK